MKIPSLKKVEAVLGPAHTWAGRCYAIAKQMVEKGLVKGKARYGHWLGPVVKGTIFSYRPIIQHGWIVVGDKIVDPTRWVFEGVKPYIYYGKNDYYDVGGNTLREKMMGAPLPQSGKKCNLPLPSKSKEYFLSLLGAKEFWTSDLFWLGNLSLNILGIHAKALYTALKKIGRPAVVPIDNYRLIMEGG
jgi:hypothetical protein